MDASVHRGGTAVSCQRWWRWYEGDEAASHVHQLVRHLHGEIIRNPIYGRAPAPFPTTDEIVAVEVLRLTEELEKVRKELEIDVAFRKLAIAERNYEQFRNEALKRALNKVGVGPGDTTVEWAYRYRAPNRVWTRACPCVDEEEARGLVQSVVADGAEAEVLQRIVHTGAWENAND
jgi:hypothetical protein